MINIGITGQAGFIGTHLFNTLSLSKDKYLLLPFRDEYFDDESCLIEFVSKCDFIIHLAAVNRHHDSNSLYNVNISLVEKLISSLKKAGSKAHVIFSSSIQEQRENIYGHSKKAGREKLINWAKENKSGFTGLIIPNVFGPFGKPFYNSVISTFSYQIVNNEAPKIEIDALLDLIYVGELVKEIENVIKSNQGKVTEFLYVPSTFSVKVTGILEKLIYFKDLYFEQGIIPSFHNNFELNLFNTFRSYIDPEKYFPVKYENHIDDRGNFVELAKIDGEGQVSFSTTKPGITRGNHFHTRKIERFAVIKGDALIQLRKIGTDKVFNLQLSGKEPAYVDMPVWFTHNITNTGTDKLYTIFWINEFYDKSDPDTYFESV